PTGRRGVKGLLDPLPGVFGGASARKLGWSLCDEDEMIFQFLFIASSLFAGTALGQSIADGVLIRNADFMTGNSENKTMKLEGNVHVVFQGQSLNCDRALINMSDQTIQADGHVILESIKVHVEGSRLQFNYKTNIGVIYDGFVQSGQVIFQGDLI